MTLAPHSPINRTLPVLHASLAGAAAIQRLVGVRASISGTEAVLLGAACVAAILAAMFVLWHRADEHPFLSLVATIYLGACVLRPQVDAHSVAAFLLGLGESPRWSVIVPPAVALAIIVAQWPLELGAGAVFDLLEPSLPAPDARPQRLVRGMLRVDPSADLAKAISRRQDVASVTERLAAELRSAAARGEIMAVRRAATYLGWLAPTLLARLLETGGLVGDALAATATGAARAEVKELLPRIAETARARRDAGEGALLAAACARLGDPGPLRSFAGRLADPQISHAFVEAGAGVVPVLDELVLDPKMDDDRLSSIMWVARQVGDPAVEFLARLTRTEVDARLRQAAGVTLRDIEAMRRLREASR